VVAVSEPGTDRPDAGSRRRFGRLTKRWVVTGTAVFVAVNAVVVLGLAASGSAKGRQFCGGGGSGGSGSSGPTCEADLSISQSDAPDPVRVGSRLFYFIQVKNGGPNATFDVTISDHLPANLELDWVMTPYNAYSDCQVQGRQIFCDFYDLRVHQRAAITIVVKPLVAGTDRNVARVSSEVPDPNTANNSVTETTKVTS
jgi:uncharacterized repeat protein (TIGR01451 family)